MITVQNITLACTFLIVAMWVLYAIGIQYLRGGWWRLLLPITVIAAILDVLLNYSLFALLTWDRPQAKELTFSQRLNRLATYIDWRGVLARWIAKYLLDWADPRGKHIYPRNK